MIAPVTSKGTSLVPMSYKPKREDEEASTVLFGRQSGPFLYYGDFFIGKIAMLKSCLWGTQI